MQQTFLLIIAGAFGAIATYILQRFGLSIVVASCIVGLLGAMTGHFLELPQLSIVIFAGSFVGMTSTAIGSIPLILLAGALTGLFFKLSSNIFVGFGGRLGTIAFLSTVLSFYLFLAVKKVLATIVKK